MTAPRLLLGKPLQQWARELGIPADTIRARVDAWGWSEPEAVGQVPHVSLRGKCRGNAVTPRYKKALDKGQKVEHNKNIDLWTAWPPRSGEE